MTRNTTLALLALFVLVATVRAQSFSAGPLVATSEVPPAPISTSAAADTAALPDAPAPAIVFETPGSMAAPANPPVAGRFDYIILPGQTAVPLHGMEKAVYGLHDAFNPFQLVAITASAGWSHLIDSQPHFGHNAEAFGKREGASALRSTIQTMATDSVFSPMFHDDPRYYALGYGHSFFDRVFYAASRVVIVRSSHSTKERFNAPLMLGYGAAAASNNAYYPDQDRGAKNTFENFGSSLAGAALGFEVDEFLDDALRMVHIRK